MQHAWGGMADGESDDFKRVLLEGNPFFLGLTFLVSLLHSIFDFFAFKNDIGFWKNKKSVEGLSVRTIGINCFCQVCCAVLCSSWKRSFLFAAAAAAATSFFVLWSAVLSCALIYTLAYLAAS